MARDEGNVDDWTKARPYGFEEGDKKQSAPNQAPTITEPQDLRAENIADKYRYPRN